ncbi:MAG: hypothetical protein CM15mP126_7470 [Gammaproteobacteria bacterium]|nr:MAG: hypothetical protein CM15mP126_7470 [Gammaproteobacteria bacterium]
MRKDILCICRYNINPLLVYNVIYTNTRNGQPDLSVPELNMAHYIDKNYLPGVMWQDTWDPEVY